MSYYEHKDFYSANIYSFGFFWVLFVGVLVYHLTSGLDGAGVLDVTGWSGYIFGLTSMFGYAYYQKRQGEGTMQDIMSNPLFRVVDNIFFTYLLVIFAVSNYIEGSLFWSVFFLSCIVPLAYMTYSNFNNYKAFKKSEQKG